LTSGLILSTLVSMELHLTPELESKLAEFSATTGRAPDDLIQDAILGYFEEMTQLRGTLDRRYDDLKSGRVQPIDGEAFFETLRQREEQLLKHRR
jgi:predicted DNA-binding protein